MIGDIPIVDAHQHFWDLSLSRHPWLGDKPLASFRYGSYTALVKDYLPGDYRRDAVGHDVVRTVYVETEWDSSDPAGEVRWIEGIAREYGIPQAVVAQAWLDRDDVGEVLASHARCPLVRGVRHKPFSARSPAEVAPGAPGSMGDPLWRAGFSLLSAYGFSFDLQTPYWHLAEAADLAHCFPETTIILNHTGLPVDRSGTGLRAWHTAMTGLARQPNVFLKISGLGIPGRAWTVEDNGPVVLDAIEVFGVDRCMFASNFPVDSLVADFDTIYAGYNQITSHLAEVDRRKLFHDNAIRTYRLDTDDGSHG